jgi:hypothetical protein
LPSTSLVVALVTQSIRKGPGKARDDFLPGWVRASSDIRITDPSYLDAGDTVVARFTCRGTHDGPLGPFPPGRQREFEAFLRDTAVPLVSRQSGLVAQHVGKPLLKNTWIGHDEVLPTPK